MLQVIPPPASGRQRPCKTMPKRLSKAEVESYLGSAGSLDATINSCDVVIVAAGWSFPAHKHWVCQASPVLCDALTLDKEGVAGTAACLPLTGPGCSKANILLLLCLLYSRDAVSFAESRSMQQLRGLVELAHAQAPGWVLKTAENALVHRAGGRQGSLPTLAAGGGLLAKEFSLANIFQWACWADSLQLRIFGNFVRRCMGANANRLDFSKAISLADKLASAQSSNSEFWLAAIMTLANKHKSIGQGYRWHQDLSWRKHGPAGCESQGRSRRSRLTVVLVLFCCCLVLDALLWVCGSVVCLLLKWRASRLLEVYLGAYAYHIVLILFYAGVFSAAAFACAEATDQVPS